MINKDIERSSRSTKKTKWSWYLYDFANSILIINGSLYFPQWVISLKGVSDFWYNMSFVASSIFILLIGPALGYLADKRLKAYSLLVISTIVLIISGCLVGLAPLIKQETIQVQVALISFFLVLVSYQLSLVFYNAMLGSVSKPSKLINTSATGLAWGWIGGIVAIFFGLLFINGYLPSINTPGGMRTVLPSAIVTGFLSVVSLCGLKSMAQKSEGELIINKISIMDFWKTIRTRMVLIFLISYVFFSDAILTLQNNSTIYMEKVFHFSDDIKAYMFIMVLLTGAIGAWLSTPVVRKLGLKKSLLGVLLAWTIVVVFTGLASSSAWFTVWFAVIGLLNGAVWAIARVVYLILIPSNLKNSMFGIYSSFERFASILGPMIWSAFLYADINGKGYRFAWLSMAAFLLIGAIVLSRIPHIEINKE